MQHSRINQSEFNHKDTKSTKKNLDFFVSFVTLWFLKTYDLQITILDFVVMVRQAHHERHSILSLSKGQSND